MAAVDPVIGWCDGFEWRELSIFSAAILVAMAALALTVVEIYSAYNAGCVEFRRCPCFKTSGGGSALGGYNSVEPVSKDSPPPSARGDIALDPLGRNAGIGSSDTPWPPPPGRRDVAGRHPFLAVNWKSYLFLFLRMGSIVLISIETLNRRFAGNAIMLILVIAGIQAAVDGATQLTSTFREPKTGTQRAYVSFGLLALVLCMGAIGVAVAQTLLEDTLGRTQWVTYIIVGTTTAIAVVASIIIVDSAFRATRSALPTRFAIALSFALFVGSAAVTLYGTTLSLDERETTAQQKGCFGDLSALGVDFVSFTVRVLYIVSGILLLCAAPVAECHEGEPKTRRFARNVKPDSGTPTRSSNKLF